MTPLEMVREFHEKFQVRIEPIPNITDNTMLLFRFDLIEEEFEELADALNKQDAIAIADALADLTYVIYGTALSLGIDLDRVLKEVHRSNMTKYLPEGADPNIPHKIQKGFDYSPPDLRPILGL